MAGNQKPNWRSLFLIGLASGAALAAEHYLALPAAADTALLVIWVLLFYGTIGAWLSRNRESLERQPAPRDSVGRPIFDNDEVEPIDSTREQGALVSRSDLRAISRSEVA